MYQSKSLSQSEHLIDEVAKNQEAMNLTCTIFDAEKLIGCKFDDAAVQSEGSTGLSKWFVERESPK